MALLPARNILDGTALPVTSQMKTALGSLRDYCSDLLGTDSGNKAAARTALGAAASGANADITSLTGLTTPLSMALGGTGMVNGFVSSLAASGHQKLPSGLIVQWGGASTSASAATVVSFPIAFTTACFRVFAVNATAGVSNATVTAYSKNASSFTADAYSAASARAAVPIEYFAIGY